MTLTEPINDGGQILADNPWTSEAEIKLSPFGVAAAKDGLTPAAPFPTVRNQVVQNYKGTGIYAAAGDGRITDCISRHNYTGARLGSSDSEISRCRLENNRDVGLWIAASTGSANCQSLNNHCFGARIACYNEGSQAYRANNDTYADALIGYFGDGKVSGSHQTTITNTLFQHNMCRSCVFGATNGHLVNCIVNVQRTIKEWNSLNIPGVISRTGNVGVELGDFCSIRGGVLEFYNWYMAGLHTLDDSKPAEGIWVNGNLVVIDTAMKDWHGVNGTVGIRIPGATNTCRIDLTVTGFNEPNSRVLVVNDASKCQNLDIILRLNDPKKPVGKYVSIGTGWTGSIKIKAGGQTVHLPQGKAVNP